MPHHFETNQDLASEGPKIEVYLGIPQSLEDYLKDDGLPVPSPIKINALIDTGASITAVKKGLLNPLGLKPVGSLKVATAGTATFCVKFNVRIHIPLGSSTYGPHITAIEAGLAGQTDVDCLIGRDLLEQAVLVYNGPAKSFSLSL